MSAAQITEAHIQLVQKIWAGLHSREMTFTPCAQLIADSEAKATAELRAEVERLKKYSANLENDVRYLTQGVPEGDPLFLAVARAESAEREVERLRECCDQTSALCGKLITEDDGTDLIPNSARIANALARLEARAERAEADADSTRERALTLANSLDEAQAELAAERVKVRTLRSACESICEEWGKSHDAPFYAGNKMDARATAALAATEDAQ